MFSGSQRDNRWCGLEGHVVSKLVRKIVTRHRSYARSTGRINYFGIDTSNERNETIKAVSEIDNSTLTKMGFHKVGTVK